MPVMQRNISQFREGRRARKLGRPISGLASGESYLALGMNTIPMAWNAGLRGGTGAGVTVEATDGLAPLGAGTACILDALSAMLACHGSISQYYFANQENDQI